MARGVCLYLVGSLVLVSLAGCGRGFFTAEREPWGADAEKACLKAGEVKESAELIRIDPISGPGVCGAEFPLKVAALGEPSNGLGYADDLRPPASIGNQPRWPISQPPPPSYSQPSYSPPPPSGRSFATASRGESGRAPQDSDSDTGNWGCRKSQPNCSYY